METETNNLLDQMEGYNKVESIEDQLRAKWQNGHEWRLDFGRLLIAFRKEARHGGWIQFLEKEFGLNRQTAFNWMRQAKETDGLPVDEALNLSDEIDPYAEDVGELIAEEREKVAAAKKIQLNGPKPIRLVLDSGTEDEKERYKDRLKRDREWVQSILRRAFDEILIGKTVVHSRKTLELVPEEDGWEMAVNDGDLPAIFQQEPEAAHVSA
jgi:transposase-like protein